MIQKTELRLGSIVRYAGIGTTGTDDWCRITTLSENVGTGGMEGLPLTPEVLRAAGFDNYGQAKECFYKDGLCLFLGSRIMDIPHPYMVIRSGNVEKRLRIDFVHQLQNIYYALTGEELAVNLPEAAK